jgi:hypothetical protein
MLHDPGFKTLECRAIRGADRTLPAARCDLCRVHGLAVLCGLTCFLSWTSGAEATKILGMYRKICVLLVVLALPLGGASDAPLDRATLRGAVAFNIVVDPVAADLENEGATTDALRTRVEDRLRDAGIKIDATSTEFVALRLTSVRAPRGPVAIAVTIALYQPVTLVRDRNVKTATQTWEVETVVIANTKQVYRACMDSADQLTDRFVTAYRSVNGAVDAPK